MAIYDINGNLAFSSHGKNVIIPNNGIISTCAGLYDLYDGFVTDGFATKTLIATVENLPMYRYDFSAVNDWATGSNNAKDTSGNKLYTKKQALFFSGLHGDEKGSPLYLYEFMYKVCYDPAYTRFLALYDIHVVPIGNPYGYNANTRNNADGININRLDESSETVEAQALMAEIDSRAYDLFIDCHNCDSDQKTARTGVTGCFSFANSMPSASEVKGFETYLKATTEVTRAIREYWKMGDDNSVQHFLPWNGTTNQTFRNYGYTHNGVGSPISACFEVSRWCYTYSNSTTQWNNKSLITGNTCLHAVLEDFLDAVVNGYFA